MYPPKESPQRSNAGRQATRPAGSALLCCCRLKERVGGQFLRACCRRHHHNCRAAAHLQRPISPCLALCLLTTIQCASCRRSLLRVQEYCNQAAQVQKIANSSVFRRPYTGCTTRPSDRVSSVIRSGSSLSEATSRQVLQPTNAQKTAAVTTTTKRRRCCTPQELCCLVEHQV